MKLNFKEPPVTDFVKTEQGDINIKYLSEEELEEYAGVWFKRLQQNQKRLLKQKEIN